MKTIKPPIVRLKNWDEIHSFQKRDWVFRGQRSEDWKLITSLERCCIRERIEPRNWSDIESELIRDFKRTYHHYDQHIPPDHATIEWISLMQHHGAPTRLLDFTYSVYVAAYFALEHADNDCAIWAMNCRWILHQARNAYQNCKMEAGNRLVARTDSNHEFDFNKLLFEPPYVKTAFNVTPYTLNRRLRTQLGTFVTPGSLECTFMENLSALDGLTKEENCVKIVIPRKLRKMGIEQLHNMNISRRSLFPGLDGYAQSLGVYHPAFRQNPPGGIVKYFKKP